MSRRRVSPTRARRQARLRQGCLRALIILRIFILLSGYSLYPKKYFDYHLSS